VVARLGDAAPHPGPLPEGERETGEALANRERVNVAPLPLRGRGQGEGAAAALAGSPRAYFPETGEVTMPRYDRAALPAGAAVTGPAVIEDEWSTIVVYPGQRAAADARGHLILDLEPIS